MSAPATKAAVYNRVPRVTTDFWLIKLMAVTMGETAADYLNVQMGLGLTSTSLIMSAVLALALFWQFAQKKYVPAAYWLSVVLISIVGTLITDNLVDNFHVPLLDTTIAFSVALALTSLLWFRAEGASRHESVGSVRLLRTYGDHAARIDVSRRNGLRSTPSVGVQM